MAHFAALSYLRKVDCDHLSDDSLLAVDRKATSTRQKKDEVKENSVAKIANREDA